MTDIMTVIQDAFGSVINALVSFFTGIFSAIESPIKTVLSKWGLSVAATGIVAPLVFVLVLGASAYLIWFFWWARDQLPL